MTRPMICRVTAVQVCRGECVWHAIHDGCDRTEAARRRPGAGATWMMTADETAFPLMLLNATLWFCLTGRPSG